MTHTETTRIEKSGGGGAVLAFIVGGILVVVAVTAWFVFSGGQVPTASRTPDVNIGIQLPRAPDINLPPAPKAPEVSLPSVPAPAR